MTWTWDQNKAERNLAKHKVSFELAARVFGDPYHQTRPDSHPDGNRWQTIGLPYALSSVLVLVVHTDIDENGNGRIISARKATAHERKAYEKGQF